MGEFENDKYNENKVIRMSKFNQVLKKVENDEQKKRDDRSNHEKLKERNAKIIEIENEYNLPLITEIPKGKKSGTITIRADASGLERLATLAAKSEEFNNKSCIVRAMINFCLPIFEQMYKNNDARQKAIGKDLYDLTEQTLAYQMDKKLLDMITSSMKETIDMFEIGAIDYKERDKKLDHATKTLPKNLKKEGKRRAGIIKGGECDIDDLYFYRQSE